MLDYTMFFITTTYTCTIPCIASKDISLESGLKVRGGFTVIVLHQYFPASIFIKLYVPFRIALKKYVVVTLMSIVGSCVKKLPTLELTMQQQANGEGGTTIRSGVRSWWDSGAFYRAFVYDP